LWKLRSAIEWAKGLTAIVGKKLSREFRFKRQMSTFTTTFTAHLSWAIRLLICAMLLPFAFGAAILGCTVSEAAALAIGVACMGGIVFLFFFLKRCCRSCCAVVLDEELDEAVLITGFDPSGRSRGEHRFTGIRDLRLVARYSSGTTECSGGVNWHLVAELENGGIATVLSSGIFGYKPAMMRSVRTAWKYLWGEMADGHYRLRPRYHGWLAFSCGLAPFVAKDRDGALKWGYIDDQYGVRVAPTFEDAAEFSEGLAAVMKRGMYGYINTAGTVVIPFRFRWAGQFKRGMASVRLSWADVPIVRHDMIDTRGRHVGLRERDAANREIESDIESPY
jgi:hypothetical protein